MAVLSEEVLELIDARFTGRVNTVITFMLEKLGLRIKQIGQLSSNDAYALANSVEIGGDINKITKELAIATGKNIDDIYPLYDQIASKSTSLAKPLYDYRNISYIPYADNIRLQRQVKSWADLTAGSFENASRTTGFNLPSNYTGKNIWYNLASGYRNGIDQAVTSVSNGFTSYQDDMYKLIKNYADQGIHTMDYPTGYSRRLDTSVRMNLLEGVRQVNQGIQNQIGYEFGADGVEISAHPLCAEDHLPYQGRQYTKQAYEELNNSLARPIGTLNCKHFAYSIVLGVSSPSYTRSQLKDFQLQSREKMNYKGQTYTKYELTQVQRKLETEIRKQKDFQIIAVASNNKQAIAKAQQNITRLTNQYRILSKCAGIPTQMERMRVPGYKRVSIK
jgi:hypothetical protein